jgi:carbamoyl-phosphate synthase small subunit
MRQGTSSPTRTLKAPKHRSERGDFSFKSGGLDLADGTSYAGKIPAGQKGTFCGEVVFNTGMTGYVESLTDPSYAGQILVFTYPLIGNYGIAPAFAESDRIQVSGVVMSELAPLYSHARAESSLLEWLRSQHIPVLTGADTRAITKHLRVEGTMVGAIGTVRTPPEKMHVAHRFISVKAPVDYNMAHKKKVILVDCGAKENILRSLLALPLHVRRVPYDYDYTGEAYDGVVLSNGPGDPTDYIATIAITRQALAKGKPIFGICLGNQLLGLAAGAKTYKLKFGHRGHNQPCQETTSERAYITSQNHSYSVDAKSLPAGWKVLFRNLNDGSVEGLEHATKPFFSVQFHPEACPGPTDTHFLFERFYRSL